MSFDENGFEMIENLVPTHTIQKLLIELSTLNLEPLRGGIRNIDQRLPQVALLAHSLPLLSVVKQYLPRQPKLVRAIYFDKSPNHNWFVTWHQDKTVAVSQPFEAEGWKCWSLKSEVWHVQPPIEVLREMVTLRIHLDDATKSNGCLKVIPGSHAIGLLPSDEVQTHVNKGQVVYCETSAGGTVIMRPHILHSSEKSINHLPRRVLHFEYSSYILPQGTSWASS